MSVEVSVISTKMSINPSEINNNLSTLREDIIQTAVKFLENPKVVSTPLAQKQKFLQRKGLTDAEVQIACERSGAYLLHESQNRNLPAPAPLPGTLAYSYGAQIQPRSFFERLKELVHNAAVIGAIAYAIYMFYKKFIKPFLFGKKKSVEDSLEELNKSMNSSVMELKDSLTSVKVEIDKINQIGENANQRQLQDLKSEIATVKGLLLNRKQFPSMSNSPVVPPSIPAWQLSSVQPDPVDQTDAKSEDLLEIGSGSGSSEPEQATKNSDSSLEIM